MKDDVAGMMTVPTVFPLSLLRCQESTNPSVRTTKTASGTADTIRQVEDRLREKRSASGRPTDLTNMNNVEMQEEKTALQKALLYYESVHGRPTTREDRDLARPLYDRYRQVKRIVMRSGSVSLFSHLAILFLKTYLLPLFVSSQMLSFYFVYMY